MSVLRASQSESEVDDRALIAEFKRTRAASPFEVLFYRYGRRLYCLAYKLYRSADLAEECVQETFWRAIQQIDRFAEEDAECNFWAWLVTIAKDVCLSEWRRNQTRIKYLEEVTRGSSRVPLTQEQCVMLSELRETIRGLPDEYRVCYLLFFVEGYTYKEVSSVTGYTQEQVKTFVQTARRHVDRKFSRPRIPNTCPGKSAELPATPVVRKVSGSVRT